MKIKKVFHPTFSKKLFAIFLFVLLAFFLFLIMLFISSLKTSKHTIKIDSINREYLLHLPSGYDDEKSYPLVLALHGYTDNPRLMEIYTGLSKKANKEKFIVVYPYGTKSAKDINLSWNGGVCCGNGVLSDVDDVKFINSLTDEIKAKYSIDEKRVFITGFSNGGILAYRIAAQTPERYSGIAVVSGSIGGKVYKELPEYNLPTPKTSIPVLIMHGKKDARIPYDGGLNKIRNGTFRSVKEAVSLWEKTNNCSEPEEIDYTYYSLKTFDKCESDKELRLYTVNEGAHVWPGSILDIKNKLSGKNVKATDIILEFFNNQEK